MKLPLRQTPIATQISRNVAMGPLGMSLSFQSEPIAANMLSWIRSQKDLDGWYRSFAQPAPVIRADLALVVDQAWVMLALEAAGLHGEALDLANVLAASPIVLPRKRGGASVDNAAAAWAALIMLHLFGDLHRPTASVVADLLLDRIVPPGLVSSSFDPSLVLLTDNMLACALWEKLGRPADLEAAKRVRMQLQVNDLYGKHAVGNDSVSLESLIMASFMTHDPSYLLRVEQDLYDSFSGGCRWEIAWRRTSHQAACFLALAEDELGVAAGRANTLRHQAISALINGITPPADVLGPMYLERESQLAYAAMLYLGLIGYRGINALWT